MPSQPTIDAFIRKWRAVELKERSATQEHFIDLGRVLDEPTRTEADSTGDFCCCERGTAEAAGGDDWSDFWKHGHIQVRVQSNRKSSGCRLRLAPAIRPGAREPPLLVVCDLDRFVVRANWANIVSEWHDFALDELREPRNQQIRNGRCTPSDCAPAPTRQELTVGEAAELVAQALRTRGHEPGG